MIRCQLGPSVEIKPGQYVCASGMIAGTCTRPRHVTRVSGERVYFTAPHGDSPSVERFMGRESVKYLCDTAEEGRSIFDLLWGRYMDETRRINEVKKQIEAEYRPRIHAITGA